MIRNIPGYWPTVFVTDGAPLWLTAAWVVVLVLFVALPAAGIVFLVRRRRRHALHKRIAFSRRIETDHRAAVVSTRRGARVEVRRR